MYDLGWYLNPAQIVLFDTNNILVWWIKSPNISFVIDRVATAKHTQSNKPQKREWMKMSAFWARSGQETDTSWTTETLIVLGYNKRILKNDIDSLSSHLY